MRMLLSVSVVILFCISAIMPANANSLGSGPIYKFSTKKLSEKTPLVWTGKYNTTFGEIRVSQIGSVASGDYAKVGKLQGSISPDGNIWRGIFYRYDGKWGVFEFKRTARGFKGNWEFSRPPSLVNLRKWDGTFQGRKVSIRNSIIEPENILRNIYPQPREELAEYLSFKYHHQSPPPVPAPKISALKQGNWYGGYDTVGEGPSITIDVDHLSGSLLVDASLGLYSVKGNGCPTNFHRALCDELNRATAKPGSSAGVQAQILGAMTEKNELFIAFGLPGDSSNRLLALQYSGTRSNPDYLARIYHETRGIEFEGVMRARPHLCEQTHCQGGRLEALDQRGTNALGVLTNLNRFLSNFNPEHDRRAQSHRRNQSASPDQIKPEPEKPVFNVADRINGEWELINEQGNNLGRITINAIGRNIKGSGQLEDTLIFARKVEVSLEELILTDEAIRFEMTYFAGESGEQHSKILLLTLPEFIDAPMKGTLQSSQSFELVTLQKITKSKTGDFEEPEENDLPGIGVTGPAYTLINVPTGKNLKLRSGPGKNFDKAGTLAWDTKDILVMRCTPEIDTPRFEEANQSAKRRLLQSSWCQVQHGAQSTYVEGYVSGKYLNPQYN